MDKVHPDSALQDLPVAAFLDSLAGSPTVKKEIVNLLILHDKKNRDYTGDGTTPFLNFIWSARDMGTTPAKIFEFYRTSKITRLRTLTPDRVAATGESRLDTLRDLALYSLLEIGFATELPHLYNKVLTAFDITEEFTDG